MMPFGPFRRKKKDGEEKSRKPRPLIQAKAPSTELPSGEEIERSVKATLLQGTEKIAGALYLTNKRLMFEAEKGEERWMIVPFEEIKEAGLYPWRHAPMGAPSSLRQCLFVQTEAGEQVWWDFDEQSEREWLPAVQGKVGRDEDEEDA
jgi:hypothetical protein